MTTIMGLCTITFLGELSIEKLYEILTVSMCESSYQHQHQSVNKNGSPSILNQLLFCFLVVNCA